MTQEKKNPYSFLLLFIAGGHLIVDFYMNIIASILPFFALTLEMSLSSLGLMLTVMLTSNSFFMPYFGLLADKYGAGIMLPIMVLLPALFIPLLGLVTNYYLMAVLAVMGGLAASFYHPLGSGFTTTLSQRRKGTAMSIYVVAGSVGFALSPLIVVPLVDAFGLSSLLYLFIPGLVMVLFLIGSGSKDLMLNPHRKGFSFQLPTGDTFKWLLILNFIAASRAWAHTAIIAFIPLYFISQGYSFVSGGMLLAVFLMMGSVGIFAAGYLSDIFSRRLFMIGTYLVATIFFLLLFFAQGIWIWIVLGVIGAAVQAPIPIMILLAQDLIPRNKGLAAGLIMGFAVGLGQVGAWVTGLFADRFGLGAALQTVVLFMVLGTVLSMIYPPQLYQVQEGKVSTQ